MMLKILLAAAFGGAFLTYFLGKISARLRNFFAVLVSLAVLVLVSALYGKPVGDISYFSFMGFPFVLRMNVLSWFFAITIAGIGLLAVVYSLDYMKGKENLDYYYFILLLINASMLATVVSGDLVSFYIFWEMMSWSTYFLISYKGGKARAAAMKYIIMSIVGSLSMLFVIVSLYEKFGTLKIAELSSAMQAVSAGYVFFILGMLSVTFIVINAFWPVHIWLPDAHAESVTPFSSVLSAVLVRKGIYGLVLFMYLVVGLAGLRKLSVGVVSFNLALCWLGAITIVFAAFTALFKDDSKRILAWSTVGQGGYMILGVAFGTTAAASSGMAGGMFHVLNHCVYIALLFYVAGAVEYRTGGIRDLNKLGGLIKKMPVTFAGGLIGIAGLIGLPLTNGFVSKWLIYKTLILGKHPFLAFAAFMGTWGTILYGYKFIHNIFLGRLPKEYENVKEVPLSMRIPIILLSATVILFGILPGIPLKVVNAIGVSFGFNSMNVNVWGIASETGTLNTINIFAAVLSGGIVFFLLFRAGKKSLPVAQDDNYAAGFWIPEKYQYTADFYAPLYKITRPYLTDFADNFFVWISRVFREFCEGVRKIYLGDIGYYVLYILFFAAVLLIVQTRGAIW